MRVVLGDFDGDALDGAVEALTQEEHEVLGVRMDVTKDEDVERLRDEAIERFGGVHVLCNNAGVIDSAPVPIWESTAADWDWVFGINFDGVLRGVRTFVPAMIAQAEPGHVVNTASVAGLIAGNGIYGVSKHAVVALTEALYQNLQMEHAPIGASVLCPPFVQTQIFRSARNRPGATEVDPHNRHSLVEHGMLPEEIADFVLDGIRAERFYLAPFASFDEAIEERASNVVARRNWVPRAMRDASR
jgi:NAD(P)-dependent dehydrogenase (short-subunit alcohol dehydrogenase family)